jgi:hypothetical protein
MAPGLLSLLGAVWRQSSLLVRSVLFDRGDERLVVGVDDEHREQLRRLGLARVAADLMDRTRRFGPALAGLVDAGLAVVHLRLDLTRDHKGVNVWTERPE